MAGATVSRILITDSEHAHPDHPLEVVLERLRKNPGILPVVSRRQIREVQGIVTPGTVMQFLQKSRAGQGGTNTNGTAAGHSIGAAQESSAGHGLQP
jgi:hypothetical protein